MLDCCELYIYLLSKTEDIWTSNYCTTAITAIQIIVNCLMKNIADQ